MELSPFTGKYLTDPSTSWRVLLDDSTDVHFAEDLGVWVISRHADVRRALGDTDTFRNTLTLAPVYQPCEAALDVLGTLNVPPTTAAADAPIHPRTRRALRAALATSAHQVLDEYGPLVQRRVDELVSRLVLRRGQTIDLVADFATQLPLLVIADILGVPERDVPRIREWADGQITLLWGDPAPDQQVHLAHRLVSFWRYCQRLVAERLASGQHGADFISRALRHRAGDDGVLTLDEVASLAFNVLVAGHETTAGLLTHALDQALSTPGMWGRLVDATVTVPSFVEEILRLRPPIDGWLRVTSREVTIGSTTIPAEARCLLLIGAANRDPVVFAGADTFDTAREVHRDHLSFGYGPHFCVGAALARLEAQLALIRLAVMVPELRLAPGHETVYRPNVAFRAHRQLLALIGAPTEGRAEGWAESSAGQPTGQPNGFPYGTSLRHPAERQTSAPARRLTGEPARAQVG